MCVSPRFYCTVDLLRELCWRKARKDRNPVMLGKTHKSILLQEKIFLHVSLRPPPLCLEMFQSEINNQFKGSHPYPPTACLGLGIKLMSGWVGVKGIDAKHSSKWVNIIFFAQNEPKHVIVNFWLFCYSLLYSPQFS